MKLIAVQSRVSPLIVAGGRDYVLHEWDYVVLSRLHELYGFTELVTGKCSTGADVCAESWAGLNEIPVRHFPANWEMRGRAAGPIRNWEMGEYGAEHGAACICFPGGKGTHHMAMVAKEKKLLFFDFRGREEILEDEAA